MTRCSTGPTVGISWLGRACQSTVLQQNNGGRTEYVSGTGVSSVHPSEWVLQ